MFVKLTAPKRLAGYDAGHTTMTNIFTSNENPKAAVFAQAWPLLTRWDEKQGGTLPTIENIENALTIMSKPGGRSAQLNQGVRALVLGFRTEGSTDGQRAYASMAGQPHNNIGKLGDLLRSNFGSSRLETGRVYDVPCPGGIVKAVSHKAGHIALTLGDTIAVQAPVEQSTDTTPKAPKAKKAKKAKTIVAALAIDNQAENYPSPSDDTPEQDAAVLTAELSSVDKSPAIAGDDATV